LIDATPALSPANSADTTPTGGQGVTRGCTGVCGK
jgi:hypothetical protein